MDLTLTPFTVIVISSLVIPVLTGLVTKASASAKLKASVALVLSLVAAAINTATQSNGVAVLSQALIQNTVLTVAVQLAMYLGVYKPVANLNEKTAPDKGLS